VPRSSPTEFLQISYAESAADGILHLIEILHPSFGSPPVPVRFARNPVDVTHDGETYTAMAFDLLPPEIRGDGTFTEAKLRIDVVNRLMIDTLRNITTPATLTHFTVQISDPDAVMHGPWTYQVRGEQTFDRQTMFLALALAPVLDEELPWKRLSPARAPGLF
jgi:hypothetical protein